MMLNKYKNLHKYSLLNHTYKLVYFKSIQVKLCIIEQNVNLFTPPKQHFTNSLVSTLSVVLCKPFFQLKKFFEEGDHCQLLSQLTFEKNFKDKGVKLEAYEFVMYECMCKAINYLYLLLT